MTLPEPEVVDCGFDDTFVPRLAVMRLRWPGASLAHETVWRLPGRVRLVGGPPEQFGIRIRRTETDRYYAYLLWNGLFIRWADLRSQQLLSSSLRSLLAAMGTDLRHLLSQPIVAEFRDLPHAA
jgi:hypothetical protein